MRPVRALFVFVAGGIGGALCDQIHVRFGTLSYPRPVLFGQAFWVPLVFGAGTLAILVAATRYARRAGTRAATPKSLVLGTLWFVGIYFASGLGFRWPATLAGVFLVTWIGRIWLRPDRVSFALFSVLLAIAGSAFEAALSAAGGFAYALPGPLLVPLWLPGLYLHGAPLAVAIASRLGPGGTAGTPAKTPAPQI